MESRSDRTLQTIQAYPFGPELGLNPSSTEDEVLLVDVGGGHGQKVLAMRARFPDLKGRMIVQDLKETIDEIQDPKGFEHMVHDFFTPQPVKGKKTPCPPRVLPPS
jgi:demethylsterigmatocystin 6-O-methyltransferase